QRFPCGLVRRRRFLEEGFDGAVAPRADAAKRAEVGREPQLFAAGLDDQATNLIKYLDVGATEAIDRLLVVAHDEKTSGRRYAPVPLFFVGRIPPGEVEQHLGLRGIGILKLVDQEVPVPALEIPADVGVFGEQL